MARQMRFTKAILVGLARWRQHAARHEMQQAGWEMEAIRQRIARLERAVALDSALAREVTFASVTRPPAERNAVAGAYWQDVARLRADLACEKVRLASAEQALTRRHRKLVQATRRGKAVVRLQQRLEARAAAEAGPSNAGLGEGLRETLTE